MVDMEIGQSWFHIEDILYPQKLRIVREVFIINTGQNYLDFDTSKDPYFIFTDITVIGRNIGLELSFEDLGDKEKTLRIILGNLENWPSVPNIENKQIPSAYKNIKLEVKYTQIMKESPNFFKKINFNFLNPVYKTSFRTHGNVQPEFHVKVPKGVHIKDKSFELRFLLKFNNNIYYKSCNVDDIIMTKYDNRRKYNVMFNSKDYNDLQESIEFLKEREIDYSLELEGNYELKHNFEFLIFPFFLIIVSFLSSFSVFISYSILSSINRLPDTLLIPMMPFSNIISLFALLLPLIFLVWNLKRENYVLFAYSLVKNLVFFLIILLLLKISLETLFYFKILY